MRSSEVSDGVGAAFRVLHAVEFRILTEALVHSHMHHVALADVHLGEVVDPGHHLRLVAQQCQFIDRATECLLQLWLNGSDDLLHLSCGRLLARQSSRPHAAIHPHTHQCCCYKDDGQQSQSHLERVYDVFKGEGRFVLSFFSNFQFLYEIAVPSEISKSQKWSF